MVRAEDALERAGSLVADSLPISRPKAQDGASKADEEIGKGRYEEEDGGGSVLLAEYKPAFSLTE